ncbi:Cyclin-dependent kinase 1 [Hondaea fermentalgiana]|uniref:Cyclin-dependent kinase 2 homolog n=1 Tax=Hondaea fermentalgiana TaxID=2315210 RepID=A0A2R5GH01_9STRA|nr:Cyclin-dependent kinase 1 [Hondaea fermentalgiana]|eukprot:GBG29875.1 Cyclin-dependent kinase 1 [Hondaea fermentalgiana]
MENANSTSEIASNGSSMGGNSTAGGAAGGSGSGGVDGSASPRNQPLQTNPPKPARVVADSFSSPMTQKRKMIVAPSRLDLDGKRSRWEDAARKSRKRAVSLDDLLTEIKMEIISYLAFGSPGSIEGIWAASVTWNRLCTSARFWKQFPSFDSSGVIRTASFQYLGLKNKGTEGNCYKVMHRRSGRLFAMKRARVYPTGEGVPYYMLRELAFLQGLRHPHIATVERISLVDNKLHLFFSYMEKSLFDLINPNNDADGGKPLPPTLIRRFLYQILQGVAFCHQRGVLHRNLKPKHLLVDIPGISNSSRRCTTVREERESISYILGLTDKRPPPVPEMDTAGEEIAGPENAMDDHVYAELLTAAESGSIRISDFALVRSTSIPLRNYTTEVVTLWYRSPEVLMGGRYFAAVDVWSVGCVFAEMILGKPLFPGICEIDQLFQIFLKLGTPNESTWSGFSQLPNFQPEFPRWPQRSLKVHVPNLDEDGVDLMTRMLDVNPNRRITAEEALQHPYFDPIRAQPKAPDVDAAPSTDPTPRVGPGRPAEDDEFGRVVSVPGQVDLNSLSWHDADTEEFKTTCWKYAGKIDRLAREDRGGAPRQGLDDMLYLIRYYHYLKALEAEMFPLADYLVEPEMMPAAVEAGAGRGAVVAVGATGAVAPGQGPQHRGGQQEELTGLAQLPPAPTQQGQMQEQLEQLPPDQRPQEEELEEGAEQGMGALARTIEEQNATNMQANLQPLHRSMLVDWLVEVIDVFDMSVRSVFMAVNYTDRYLAKQFVQRNRFQLLGATCLHIASKCEDVSYIGVEDLVVCADKVYGPEDVLRLEEKVLNTLDFHISVPTVIDFLNVFIVRLMYSSGEDQSCTVLASGISALREMHVSKEAKALAQYLAELSLQEHFFIAQMPSCVAAAALGFALFLRGLPIYPERFEAVTGYSLKALRPCVERLSNALQDAPLRPNLHVILRRYQRPQNFSVAVTSLTRPLYTMFE